MKYQLPSIPVWVEETVCNRQINATGFDVEQLSILRLPDGGLQCRATLAVSDGTSVFRKMVTATNEELEAAIGAANLAALMGSIGNIIGALLTPKVVPE